MFSKGEQMATGDTATEAYRRLDALKHEIDAFAKLADSFEKVAAALKNPLNWGFGGGSVNYAINNAPTELPDIRTLKERIGHIHDEHFQLLHNVSRQLEGTLKDNLMKELMEMQGLSRRY